MFNNDRTYFRLYGHDNKIIDHSFDITMKHRHVISKHSFYVALHVESFVDRYFYRGTKERDIFKNRIFLDCQRANLNVDILVLIFFIQLRYECLDLDKRFEKMSKMCKSCLSM